MAPQNPKDAPETRARGPEDEITASGLHIDVEKQRQTDTWTIFIGIRTVNALLLSTFFQPDEYFQALEPAWDIVFGSKSGAWITWEWRHMLRSSLHPYFYAAIYKSIAWLMALMSTPPTLKIQMFQLVPKGVNAGLASLVDLYTWQLAERLFGPNTYESYAVMAMTVLSPWNLFVSTRTFSNGFETALTAMALFYWPWSWVMTKSTDQMRKRDTTNLKLLFVLAGFACILRPTNILIWAVLTVFTLPYATQTEFIAFIRDASIFGSVVLSIAQYADKQYYGEWVLAPARWISFNINQNLAVHYGKSRLDYYFTEGLPLLLTTALPFAFVGLYRALSGGISRSAGSPPGPSPANAARLLAVAGLATPVVLSAISHKEVRFLYPTLPIFLVLAASPVASFFHPFPAPKSKGKLAILMLLAAASASIGIYVSFVHNRAVVDVITYLRQQYEASNPNIVLSIVDFDELVKVKAITVGFLMPCHSTPWRSMFVYPRIDAWALTCEPPIDVPLSERDTYLDEADQFYADPQAWLNAHMAPVDASPSAVDTSKREWPQYLVFFEQLEPTLQTYLETSNYSGCWRAFNTLWHDDWRRKGDVIVYCKDLHPQPDLLEGKRDMRAGGDRWSAPVNA